MTVTVDDAGSGDLLFGVVVGAFRDETREFRYGIIDVKFFQGGRFYRKEYLRQCSRVVSELLGRLRLGSGEEIRVCQGYIFDVAIRDLRRVYGDGRVRRVRVGGEAQRLTELAYVDELRNLGYEPVEGREGRRAKSFFDMMRWLRMNPDRLRYAKTGWPRLLKYQLFRSHSRARE